MALKQIRVVRFTPFAAVMFGWSYGSGRLVSSPSIVPSSSSIAKRGTFFLMEEFFRPVKNPVGSLPLLFPYCAG